MATRNNETGRDVAETGTQHYSGTPADPNGRAGSQERTGTWSQQGQGQQGIGQQGTGQQGQRFGRYYQSAVSRSWQSGQSNPGQGQGYGSQRDLSYGSGSQFGQGQRSGSQRDLGYGSQHDLGYGSGYGNLGSQQTSGGYQGAGLGRSDQDYGRRDWDQDRGYMEGRDYGRGELGRSDVNRGDYGRGDLSRDFNRGELRGDFNRGDTGRGDIGRGMETRSYGEGGLRQDWTRDARGQGTPVRGEHPLGWMRGGDLSPGYDLGFETRQRRGFWQREPLTARDVMTKNVRSVTRQSTLRDVAQIMKDENCGIVPVVDSEMKLIGVLTDRDMVVRAFISERGPGQVKVEDVMTDDVECVTADERLVEVIHMMGSKQIRRVPVVDRDDRLLGIISMGDIANRADYDHDLQEAFEKVSSKRSFWSKLFG